MAVEAQECAAHHFKKQFIGLEAFERDAIGTVLHIQCEQESWTTSLCDGEGYFGSNQRLIHVGIGNQSKIQSVKCTWPNGNVETIENLQPDHRYRWIEGLGLHEIPLQSTVNPD